MTDQVFCTLADVVADLEKQGVKAWSEAAVLEKIRSASDFLARKLGQFIPVTEERRFDGSGSLHLFVDPLLAVISLTDDGDAIGSSQYLLYPRNRHWPNGPYTRLTIDPDATALSCWTAERDVDVITGRWGLYEESAATGATVANATQLAAGGTSLLVSNGAKVSPGMTLLVESEQLLITATGDPTDSATNTNEAIDNVEDEIDLVDAAQVNIGEIMRVNFEQMKVLDKLTNTVLVARGWNGTKVTTHETNQDVYVYRTFTVKRGVNGTTDAAHTNGTAISRYVVPHDVGYLCTQIAALMMKKAESGYAGRIGSVETGETFYYREIPDDPLKRIAQNYRIVSL